METSEKMRDPSVAETKKNENADEKLTPNRQPAATGTKKPAPKRGAGRGASGAESYGTRSEKEGAWRREQGSTAPLGDGVGHLAAGFGAGAASLGALLAVLDAVLVALGAAGVANFRAEGADVGGEFGTAGHLARGEGAEIGAAAVKLDAVGHHLDVFFAEARGGAAFAGIRTSVAGLDAVVEG